MKYLKMPHAAVIVCLVLLFIPMAAHAVHQVEYVKEIAIEAPLAVAVGENGRVYTAHKEGFVKVTSPDGKLLLTIGGKGADGKPVLKRPVGIALHDDKVFVTDESLCKVMVFFTDGRMADGFGSCGGDPKEFDDPRGIFIYEGIIYVADSGNKRVQVLSENGVYMGSIGTEGAESETLKYPTDVAVDYRGHVYVVDGKSKYVKIYTQSGVPTGNISGPEEPLSIAMSNDGMYVTDASKYRIVKFDFKGAELASFGSEGKGRGQFVNLSGIALDNNGNIYTADPKRGVVQVFRPAKGEPHANWQKTPPISSVGFAGELDVRAWKIITDAKGRIYAVDRDKKAVYIIEEGNITRTIMVPKVDPVSVAISPSGAIWVLDKENDRLVKLDAAGNIALTVGESGSKEGYFSGPTDMVISKEGVIYVADRGNNRVQAFKTDGVFLKVVVKNKEFSPVQAPLALALDNDGLLYVLDDEKRIVAAFNPDGNLATSFGREGDGKGLFRRPVSLAVTATEIYVLDAEKGRVSVFNKKGDFLREFGSKGESGGDFDSPHSIAFMDDIMFAVSDPERKKIITFYNTYTPNAPPDIASTDGMRSVTLRWPESPETFVNGYKVYRGESSTGDFALIAAVKGNSYEDKNVEPEKTYYYRVSALAKGGNESRKIAMAKATPLKYKTTAPSGLKATADEWSIDLSWEPNPESFLLEYKVYIEEKGAMKEIGRTDKPSFSVPQLEPNTPYKLMVSSISSDKVETPGAVLEAATKVQTKPPIEIHVVDIDNVFSNSYKIYENEGIGRVKLVNNTKNRIQSLKLTFGIKEFMDYPSEIDIQELKPLESREAAIKAVFNNKILEVTEDTPVQAEIGITYYENQNVKKFLKNQTINIYEKHKMMWDVRQRFATFITPKDAVVLDFTRSIVTQYGGSQDPILYAAVIYDSLGVLGLTYMQDPSNPYQVTAGKTDFVDYLQYPRETLNRKSGDCDDLVGVYSSALESIGIRTKVVEVPGHMLMMFSTAIEAEADADTMGGMMIVHDGQLWIPVETTLVGSSFMKAWEAGSKAYYEWEGKGLTTLDIREAWGRFKPASLPAVNWQIGPVKRADIDSKFDNEYKTVKRIRLGSLTKKYVKALSADPNDVSSMLQLGIIYAKEDEPAEAIKIFERAMAAKPDDPSVLNNLGNVLFMEKRYGDAKRMYERATQLQPDDPLIWVNLARCYLRLEAREPAKEAFKKALELDPEISNKFRAMALEFMGMM